MIECCAVIPARGGSRGIPRKNLAPLAGRPLIAHSISAASAATRIGRVVVSTDDDEIARVAASFGADVVNRPVDIAGDMASSESALTHALDSLRDRDRYEPQILAFLQCTSPLTTSLDIDGTIALVADEDYDCALSVSAFHYFLWRRGGDGQSVGVNHVSSQRLLRQQREPEYRETGAVYAMRVAGFRAHAHRFFGRIGMYETPVERCLEIDGPGDLEIAAALMHRGNVVRALLAERGTPEFVVCDFDGVFTDNAVWVLEDGSEAVRCNRSDGLGLTALRKYRLPILVLSTEKNALVAARCRKLGLECIHGVDDKLAVLERAASARSVPLDRVLYVGNDANDVACMRAVGLAVAVADSHPSAMAAADAILAARGGYGAIRELCDALLETMRQ